MTIHHPENDMQTNQTEVTALATIDEQPAALAPMQSPGNTALILDPQHLQNMMALANVMATGTATVPAHLQKKPGDCLAVVMQAAQWGMNPFAVAQKTHIVNGTLGYEAQLVNAVLEATGAIEGRFHYEHRNEGAALETRCAAVCAGEKDLTWGEWLKASDVTVKNSPLWKTNPKQQMQYLQVKNWARAFKPGAILGVYTTDELQQRQPPRDMGAADVVVPPALLANAQAAADKGVAAYQEFWKETGAVNRAAIGKEEHELLKQRAETADKARTVDNAASPPPPAAEAAAGAAGAAPKVNFASVLDSMVKAKNRDALDVAADWIGEVPDPAHRAELSTKYEELKAKFA